MVRSRMYARIGHRLPGGFYGSVGMPVGGNSEYQRTHGTYTNNFPLRVTPTAVRADLLRVARNRAVLCTITAVLSVAWTVPSMSVWGMVVAIGLWVIVLFYQWCRFGMLRDGTPLDQVVGVAKLG